MGPVVDGYVELTGEGVAVLAQMIRAIGMLLLDTLRFRKILWGQLALEAVMINRPWRPTKNDPVEVLATFFIMSSVVIFYIWLSV